MMKSNQVSINKMNK